MLLLLNGTVLEVQRLLPNTWLKNIERNATQPVVQDPWVFGGAMGSQLVTHTTKPHFPCCKSAYLHQNRPNVFLIASYTELQIVLMPLIKIFQTTHSHSTVPSFASYSTKSCRRTGKERQHILWLTH